MGGDLAAIFKPDIGQKAFVATDQRGGHKRGLKAHEQRPIQYRTAIQGEADEQPQSRHAQSRHAGDR